jgi:hypothetical protein
MNEQTLSFGRWALPLLVCIAIAGDIANSSAVRADNVRAEPAFRFVDSAGVATHFGWGGSVYRRRYSEVKEALAELGIRHIRDQVSTDWAVPAFRDLHDSLGVRVTAVVDARHGSRAQQRLEPDRIAGEVSRLRSLLGAHAIAAIEGPNEINNLERLYGYRGWPEDLKSYQSALYRHVSADNALDAVPVVAPTLADPIRSDP